jgi:thiol-disulfide isomerase/thioredoxin
MEASKLGGRIAAIAVLAAVAVGIGASTLSRTADGDDAETQDASAAAGSTSTEGEAALDQPVPDQPVLEQPVPVLDPKPELSGLDGWLNAPNGTTGLADFDGQVRIVQFWTFGCYNCTNTLPHLQEIYAEHRDDGLEIIGIHAPEFDYEADVDNIAAAAVDLGVDWPIALDTDKTNFRRWQGSRRFWPRTYVLDRDGNVRYDHIGEGRYDELAATVAQLLDER